MKKLPHQFEINKKSFSSFESIQDDHREEKINEWKDKIIWSFDDKESYLNFKKEWKEVYKDVSQFRRSMKSTVSRLNSQKSLKQPISLDITKPNGQKKFINNLNSTYDLNIKISQYIPSRDCGKHFAQFMNYYLEAAKQHSCKIYEQSNDLMVS